MLPLEFVVFGTPISHQASSDAKRLWRERVRAAAESRLNAAPSPASGPVLLRVAYFYVYAPAADMDNIVKPIQDALKGIAYADDIQVVDILASMRPKSGADRLRMSVTLATGFAGGSDFVHVVVDHSTEIEALR